MRVNSMSSAQARNAERPEPLVPRQVRPVETTKDEVVPAAKTAAPAHATPDGDETSSPASVEEVDRAVDTANELARRLDVKILFRRSEETDDFRLQIVDRETGEVIRQVPPEEMIAHMKSFSGFEGLLTESGRRS